MASANVVALLAILLVPQFTAADVLGDFLSPLLSPVLDDVCKEVECGKGTCKPSPNSSFFFVCECETGWSQSASNNTSLLKFLPCVIPNCTMNYSCSEASAPIQQKAINPLNESIFDPCFWSYCGGGSCSKKSNFTHSCNCNDGYYNLLNTTSFPCFKECAFGVDCSTLGITVTNKSASSTPSMADAGENKASSVLGRDFFWLIILMIPLAMIL
ncbi:uncharacterized protein LOC131151116 [Malania oleifera]|uniref:uncharacterized protein LOC131151116 n=1 Tax=Malania oleifera TaxID=397392 RepID=UPI0025ADB217|nr:uncharacterized protein LOC131151116 [Malania oleifera]